MSRREKRQERVCIQRCINSCVHGGGSAPNSLVWRLRAEMVKHTGFFEFCGPRFVPTKPVTVDGQPVTDHDWLFNSGIIQGNIKRATRFQTP